MDRLAPTPGNPLASALKAALGLVLFGGATAVAAHSWLGLGGPGLDSLVAGPLYYAVIVAASLACLVRAVECRVERGAWIALSGALAFWAAGGIYRLAILGGEATQGEASLADVAYLGFYPLTVIAIALLIRARARELDWRLWMDGVIAALGTAAVGAALVFAYVASRTDGSNQEVAAALAYPLADIVSLGLLVGVVSLTRWRPGRTWSLLLAGLAILALADITYTMQLNGGLPAGSWSDPIYLLGAVCIGIEAWQPGAETIPRIARFDGWRELVIPGFFALITLALFAIQYARPSHPLTAALTVATMLAVIARLAISVRENKRLLALARTDRLTGLGNQAGLQVDLAKRCELAGHEPFALLVLDLNGFKAFNDTFGHPAGDAILARLGGQLKSAVGASGKAYRAGGDEFAALLDCAAAEIPRASKRAAEALTAIGDGYELGASWGVVEVPAEAATPSEAMKLADTRMYAQKQSRQIALGPTVRVGDAASLRAARQGEAVEQGA